jgi:hypothetical protein
MVVERNWRRGNMEYGNGSESENQLHDYRLSAGSLKQIKVTGYLSEATCFLCVLTDVLDAESPLGKLSDPRLMIRLIEWFSRKFNL